MLAGDTCQLTDCLFLHTMSAPTWSGLSIFHTPPLPLFPKAAFFEPVLSLRFENPLIFAETTELLLSIVPGSESGISENSKAGYSDLISDMSYSSLLSVRDLWSFFPGGFALCSASCSRRSTPESFGPWVQSLM
uniref:Uncharacterized protein n=1 Tax=Phlegmariurus squarrosus TaxID=73615 RepID=H9M832_PHLSQ|nr:hypothetical protein HusqMp24 [Phlegmariurus squarrosus]AEV55739.1 hypothetical protein HusqMp24 [Phlegmariurus squarrosus]